MNYKGAILKYSNITGGILNAFYKKVYSRLGYGFREQVYENSMAHELRKLGFKVEQQRPINVYYDGIVVGQYFSDLVVNAKVIVELKAAKSIVPEHEAQLLNYLRATPYEVGMLLNFGPKAEHKRKVFDNDKKKSNTWIPN